VPAKLVTGVREADEVSAALHQAGLRSREATTTLERRVAEAVGEAREAQARLLNGQKHEAIGRLTGGLAHDFNNLLQTISTGLHVMEMTATASQRRVLESSARATAKAGELIRQMLAFGKDIEGDRVLARSHYEQYLANRREVGDKRGIVVSLVKLGWITLYDRNLGEARALFEEGAAICHSPARATRGRD
jgi:signal transduction histidine kinase